MIKINVFKAFQKILLAGQSRIPAQQFCYKASEEKLSVPNKN